MLGVLAALTIGAASQGLTPLFPHCTSTIPNGCGDFAKPVWKRFESTTGEITKLDTASVQPTQGGGAIAAIYTYSPGNPYDPRRLRQIVLTCRGQFADMESPTEVEDAPPRSVIGLVAAVACALAEPKRQAMKQRQRQEEAVAEERGRHPRPEDYCQGFTSDACGRIQAGVDAPIKPPYCKPGSGLVGSGLTDEQLRICYARPDN